jgi:BirA family biotin operon repressor/biotin-[acetyl-CoA-carboxylase] ligase
MIPLDEARLNAASQTAHRIGREVRVLAEATSTNDLCHEHGVDPTCEGLTIFAEHQSSGRGRMGRQWSAPPGSALLFSILVFPPAPLSDPTFLVAWSAVAIASLLRDRYQVDAKIKWPNDLLVDGRKLCGILVERRKATVVGVGLNVSIRPEDFPSDLRMPATSLEAECGSPVDRTELAAELLRRLDVGYREALERGTNGVFERWPEYAEDLSGRWVRATTSRTTLEGRLISLSPRQGARLAAADGSVVAIDPHELVHLEPEGGR